MAYTPLKLSEIEPAGWIYRQMLRDLRNGIAGHFLQLRPDYGEKTYIDKDGNLGRGEMTGNWADGFIRMAFFSGEPNAISRAREFVSKVLDSADEDGYLGNIPREKRYRNAITGELWTQSRLYVALLAYYELTGERNVLDAVKRAVNLTISKYDKRNRPFVRSEAERRSAGNKPIQSHGLMFVDVLEWLYRIDGDRRYVDFAKYLYNDFSTARDIDDRDMQISSLLDSKRALFGHGVHTVEQARVPLFLKYTTGNSRYSTASDKAFEKLSGYITPGGAVVSQEAIFDTVPLDTAHYEYCTITEFASTLESALAKSGDMHFADMIEMDVFNAAQEARSADGKAISYLTSDSRMTALRNSDFPYTGKRRCQMSPAHRVGGSCCSANSVKVLPYYLSSMWMKSNSDRGISALLFGPSRVRTSIGHTEVVIMENTDYPFDDEIDFNISTKRAVTFSFTIRKPSWAGEMRVKSPGADIVQKGDRFIVTKRWKRGDWIRVTFENPIRISHLPDGKVSIYRGALLFAQKWGYTERTLPRRFNPPGFREYELRGRPNYPYSPHYIDPYSPSFGFHARWRRGDALHPWSNPPLLLEGKMKSASRKDGYEKRVRLFPAGSLPVRFSAFRIWPFPRGETP
jgi:DUF1680 family protein